MIEHLATYLNGFCPRVFAATPFFSTRNQIIFKLPALPASNAGSLRYGWFVWNMVAGASQFMTH
ncbi:hypothetical protein Cflav_PD4887 [Pedosphaera parvula Ellin514]|uniref:Uncharacterized protein n=1 Tax=Pedosphaera parvula (strain Ellin514) TaxID=320771 RepID=B9XCQ6_PEDPL|nr:hypothetical protein Cflav_PD4887 [Pedosphaera parvula Ellin514]